MTTKDIIYDLRSKNGLSQDDLAEKVFVTRQAVSRWENGETVPNTETLKLLSNEDYCKWCYADGTYTYNDMDDLIDVCVGHMAKDGFTEEQARSYMKEMLPSLDYWKRHDELSDGGKFDELKKQLIREINDLQIEGMPEVDGLNALVGRYVNLEYPLPSGLNVKFLDDSTTYLGNQLEPKTDIGRCFGILANIDFILVCTYGEGGTDPELLLYKKRSR